MLQGGKRLLKTVTLAVKSDKLAIEKSGKSKQTKVTRVKLTTDRGLHRPEKTRLKACVIEK